MDRRDASLRARTWFLELGGGWFDEMMQKTRPR